MGITNFPIPLNWADEGNTFGRGGIIAKQAVYLGGFVGWFGTHTQRDVFPQCVGTFGCNGFLSGKNTLEYRPVISDALQFKFVTDGVDYPICQQPEKEVSIGTFVFLMIDGTQVQAVLS